MSHSTVKMALDEHGVATVTLNRPAQHNAFDAQTIVELHATFETVSAMPEVRLVVVAAAGKNFSSGADLNWMRRMAGNTPEENIRDANALAAMLHALNFLPKPTIARVQGAAIGGGAGLVCCCDVAVASAGASFAFSEVKIGLIPATISPYVIRAIGAASARRYFLTAERISSERACQLGMVSEVVAESDLDARIHEIATAILHNSPDAVHAAKRLVFEVEGKAITAQLLQFTSEQIAEIRASDQGKEGLTAFLEKRKPSWIS